MPRKTVDAVSDEMDLETPYDIYVSEGKKIVVYRGAIFRGNVKLSPAQKFDYASDFYEILQANGGAVYIRRHSIVKFCEPGTKLEFEVVGDAPESLLG